MTDAELRDLDARVHREVFGLVVRTDRHGHHWTDEVGLAGLLAVPRYTTDIAAAWRVVEHVQAVHPGWRFSLLGGDSPFPSEFDADGNYRVGKDRRPFHWRAEFFGHEDPRLCTGRRHGEGAATTPALAVCLAALKAVENRPQPLRSKSDG